MKIVIEHLKSIEGVEIFAIIALLIFFTIFVLMFVYAIRADKEEMKAYGNIPLEDDDSPISDL